MAVAWALTNKVDAIVTVTPPSVKLGVGGSVAGKNTYSGAFRAVRATLTASGAYAAGGTALTTAQTGLGSIEAMLVLTDNPTPAAVDGQLVFNPTTGKLQIMVDAGTEHGATPVTGVWEVLILGR